MKKFNLVHLIMGVNIFMFLINWDNEEVRWLMLTIIALCWHILELNKDIEKINKL